MKNISNWILEMISGFCFGMVVVVIFLKHYIFIPLFSIIGVWSYVKFTRGVYYDETKNKPNQV